MVGKRAQPIWTQGTCKNKGQGVHFLGGGGVGEPPMIKSIINQREGGSKVSQSNYVFCTYCVM